MISDEALLSILDEHGYADVRHVDGRGFCGLMRMMFTVGVCVGLDETGMKGRICFDTWQNAQLFLSEWDGKTEPVVGEDGCTAIKVLL